MSNNIHVLSLVKAFTWRLVATSTVIVIAYVMTGTIHLAIKIGAVEFIIKIGLYYIHEIIWNKVNERSQIT